MIEDAAYATTYDRLPRAPQATTGGRPCASTPTAAPSSRDVLSHQRVCLRTHGLVFEPGWIYQGSIWRSRPTEEGMSARQLESMLRATARMRELSSSHKRRDRHGPWQGFVVLSEAFQR